jgi:hypothetical protein
MNEIGSYQTVTIFDRTVFFENLLRRFKLYYNRTRITGTSHEDQCTFMIPFRSFLLIMRKVSGKRCREHLNTHFMFNNIPEIRAVYEIMWKNTVEPGKSQMTI